VMGTVESGLGQDGANGGVERAGPRSGLRHREAAI
jgi:hypothetical protein